MLSRLSSRFDMPISLADWPHAFNDSADTSEPVTLAFGNLSAVKAAWLVPHPATHISEFTATRLCFQSPRAWFSITVSKSGSTSESNFTGRQGKEYFP